MRPRACPRCQEELKDGAILKSHRPPVCPRLHGIFLDHHHVAREFYQPQLRSLKEGLSGGPDGELACPTCTSPMRPVHLKADAAEHVEVDGCPSCGGFWFDFGELDSLRRGFDAWADEAEEEEKGWRVSLARLAETLRRSA